MCRAVLASLACALLCWVDPSPSLAQETRGSEFTDVDESPRVFDYLMVRLTLAERYTGKGDFGAFSASSHQPEARLRVSIPVAENAAVRLFGGGRAHFHDFDGTSDLFGLGPSTGAPFGDLYTWELRAQGAYLFDEELTFFSDSERWSLLAQGGVRSSWESGSDMTAGLRGGGSLALGYRLSDRFELVVGAALGSRLVEGGVSISPLIDFDWRINPNWRLRSYGTGLQLERKLVPDLVLFTRARLESQKFRLGARPGGVGKGSVRIRKVPVGLGVQWRPWRWLRLRIGGGVMAYNQLLVKDAASDTLSSVSSDVAPYFNLRIDVRN